MILAAISCAMVLSATGCGSSSGRNSPPVPNANIGFVSFLVDIGERFELTGAGSTNPEEDDLEFFWTKIHPTSETDFDEHCEEEPKTVCFTNDDDVCRNLDAAGNEVFCHSEADCVNGDDDQCVFNSGTSSPECTVGICLLGQARLRECASFVADRPGPYRVRLQAETSRGAANVEEKPVSTYPQMLVVGSLFGFGGARGAFISEYPDADTFASDASAGVSSPITGNMLLAVTTPGLVREFLLDDGSIVGTFGETATAGLNPIDIVFGQDENLYAVQDDGIVMRFDGTSGLFIGIFGDVTTGAEEVVSIGIRAGNGNLLAVDGRAGEPVREYGINSGEFRSFYGDTGTAVVQSVDLDFALDGSVYIADLAGDIVTCAENGTACSSLGGASSALAAGGPSAIAVNPAADQTVAQIVVSDMVNEQVVGCLADGSGCFVLGDTVALGSAYSDVFFAPPDLPTTTTTTIPTTTSTSSTSTTSTTLAP
jgi:hypothetical protein